MIKSKVANWNWGLGFFFWGGVLYFNTHIIIIFNSAFLIKYTIDKSVAIKILYLFPSNEILGQLVFQKLKI